MLITSNQIDERGRDTFPLYGISEAPSPASESPQPNASRSSRP